MTTTTTAHSGAAVPTGCCPPFDPSTWADREVTWRDHPFVKEHVTSFFHVPLNMGHRVLRAKEKIDAAGAAPAQPLMLSDEKSAWGADLYIEVTGAVPDAQMAMLSGTFLTRVYDGPFSDAPKWAADMARYVASKQRSLEKLYFAYTTCPRCAKAYGHNYVVLFARVAPAAPQA